MMEFILIYRWTLPAGCLFAGGLALLGCQLAARDRAMQTVCVSQGAMLGVLLALGIQPSLHANPVGHIFPFALAVALSSVTFLGTGFLARKKTLSKSTLFAAVFSVLLSSGYFVSAVFPALESHMSQIYFGDLSTLTEFDAKLTLVLGAVSTVLLSVFRHPITGQSFELATFGYVFSARTSRRWALLFNALAIALLCFSVQFLGFLFTVSLLFLPTTVLSMSGSRGLSRHLIQASLCAVLSTLFGFLISLRFTRFPTVPTVTLTLLILSAITCAFLRAKRTQAGRT